MIIKNKDCLVSLKGSCDPNIPLLRGAKTQNFPDSNFLRAKTFRTKCVKSFLTTSLKSAFASHDIAKEAVMNVLAPPHHPTPPQSVNQSGRFEIIQKIGSHLKKSGQF